MISPIFIPFIARDMMTVCMEVINTGCVQNCAFVMTYAAMAMHNEPEMTIELEDVLKFNHKPTYDMWLGYKANFEKINTTYNQRHQITSDELLSQLAVIDKNHHGS